MNQIFQFTVESEDQGARLDKFLMTKFRSSLILSSSNGLAEKMPEYSRAALQKLIKEKKVLINGKETKASVKLKTGDVIEVNLEEKKIDLIPDSSVKFGIIHEEKDFAVIDKPAGLVVYPGTKHEEKTLVSGLLAKWPEIRGVGDPEYSGLRPGIVHRLDKDTSGLMIIAKNNGAFQYFKNLFKEKKIEKTYTALVYGKMEKQEGVIDFPIRRSRKNPVKQVAVKGKKSVSEAREAVTNFRVVKYFSDKNGSQYTLVEAKPKTGRMHQIRVHFAALGHPIIGDAIYKLPKSKRPEAKRHLLHAASLKFISSTGKYFEFSSELPDDFREFIKNLC